MNQNEIAEAKSKWKELQEKEAFRDFKQFTYNLTGRGEIRFLSFRYAFRSLKEHTRNAAANDTHAIRLALNELRRAYEHADTLIARFFEYPEGGLQWSTFVAMLGTKNAGSLWASFLRKAHDAENDREER